MTVWLNDMLMQGLSSPAYVRNFSMNAETCNDNYKVISFATELILLP